MTLRHIDAGAPGQGPDGTVTCDNNDNDDPSCPFNDILVSGWGLSDALLAHNYFHGSSWHANVWTDRWDRVIVEHNYFHNSNRKEVFSDFTSTNVTIRNNVFENSAGTGAIVFRDSQAWSVYGNVFFTTNPTFTTTDCIVCTLGGHGHVNNDMNIYRTRS